MHQPLRSYLTTVITVGHHGYGVIIDDAKGQCRVTRSWRLGVEPGQVVPFEDGTRDAAIAAAVLMAVRLDETRTAETLAALGAVEAGRVG